MLASQKRLGSLNVAYSVRSDRITINTEQPDLLRKVPCDGERPLPESLRTCLRGSQERACLQCLLNQDYLVYPDLWIAHVCTVYF